MLASLAFAAAVSLPPPESEAWFVASLHDGGAVMVSRASITREGRDVRYYAMSVPIDGRISDGVAYQINGWRVNCATMSGQLIPGGDWTAAGEPLPYFLDTPILPPGPLSPGTPAFETADAVCKNRWNQGGPWTTSGDAYRAYTAAAEPSD